MSFGETLQRLRTERDLSKYALEKHSGVPHANITQFESGMRGVPTFRTVSDLAMGMGLAHDERQKLLELALGERFLVEMEKFAIYYYLALVTDAEVERVMRYVRKEMGEDLRVVEALRERGVQGHELSLYDLLVAIAEMPDLAHLRQRLAAKIVETVTCDLRDETVHLRPGPIADDLLERRQPAQGGNGDRLVESARDRR